MAYYLE